jgi:hypothetical protein
VSFDTWEIVSLLSAGVLGLQTLEISNRARGYALFSIDTR